MTALPRIELAKDSLELISFKSASAKLEGDGYAVAGAIASRLARWEDGMSNMEMRGTRDGDSPRGAMVFCFAEGAGDCWEAFCVDFDLAVQGRSFEEVYRKLEDQVMLYVEGAIALPEPDRTRLLHRRAPLSVTLPLTLRMIWTAIRRTGRNMRHDYTMPTPNIAAA